MNEFGIYELVPDDSKSVAEPIPISTKTGIIFIDLIDWIHQSFLFSCKVEGWNVSVIWNSDFRRWACARATSSAVNNATAMEWPTTSSTKTSAVKSVAN